MFDACKELLSVLRTESGSNKDRRSCHNLAALKRLFRAPLSDCIPPQLPFEASSRRSRKVRDPAKPKYGLHLTNIFRRVMPPLRAKQTHPLLSCCIHAHAFIVRTSLTKVDDVVRRYIRPIGAFKGPFSSPSYLGLECRRRR